MKRSIFIFFCLLLMVTAFADVRFQPIYLRLTSYPRNAGVVFAENPYRNSGQPEFHVSKSFSFNSIEESDTDMVEIKMVLYAATGDARYKVYAKPNDGFFSLDLIKANMSAQIGWTGVFMEKMSILYILLQTMTSGTHALSLQVM